MRATNPPSAIKKENVEKAATVKTLRKALHILDQFSASDQLLTVAEVASRVGIARPTAYRLVQTLIQSGYLQHADNGKISPGYSILQLAATLLDTNRLRIESLPHLEALSHATGERTNLGILHRGALLYLAGMEKPSLPVLYSRFGRTAPAYCTALGKALLAFLPAEELNAYLKATEFTAHTSHTVVEKNAFVQELDAIRKRGYATDEDEHSIGASCIAVPILVANKVIASVGVTGRSLEALEPQLDQVMHTAELIAHVMGRGT